MTDSSPAPRPVEIALLASVFVVAACGLLYELAAGTLASYVLGDSVLQFSTIIGTYLFAMGVGSYLSRFFERQLPAHFLRIELMVALVGGMLPAALFLANAYVPGAFRFLLYGMVMLVGTFVGLAASTVTTEPPSPAAPESSRPVASTASQTRHGQHWPVPTRCPPGAFRFHTGCWPDAHP